ncbi:sulfate ABC transporter permease subunit CysT [Aneurinibacillus sp. Ricciae_BoGa-3]|uniref:sulfate ABC transporter permease subunit CysT n=1 Tax=Aneurinibacillus sp. Ricciae_BoGa-3 TaxID=3022697 RepID=UPI00234110C8|nr:sulfate ABC transporter permease subunit CysT [Aneurinibacillus sp. Ricciae_BoGa-3]WCK56206.1 sulfate ABC transporter permease subunit CysT [Aneurinibacillus sp. Ricciae_BoGa-3]
MKSTSRSKPFRVLPGFNLTLGYTLLYLTVLVLLPLSILFIKSAAMSPDKFLAAAASPRVMHAYYISFGTSLAAGLINMVFGLLVAWVLVRYRFPGKKIIDGLVDLPFALPTAVAGIALTAIYSDKGWIGGILASVGIKAAFNPLGIIIALTFIGLPFVVRTVQPVLEDMDAQMEEAAHSLGATPLQTFRRVILPGLFPALLSGFALAFARALGEYGSVVFISGNMPMKTEIAPLLIMTKLEQFDYAGATAIACVMLVVSFLLLFLINMIQWRTGIKQHKA